MCCGFRHVSGTIASMMHMTEKLISCFAVASVITCFVFTTVCMIALGIGIGYNYCIGEMSPEHSSALRQRNMYFPASQLQAKNTTELAVNANPVYGNVLAIAKETGIQNDTKALQQDLSDFMDSTDSNDVTIIAGPASTEATPILRYEIRPVPTEDGPLLYTAAMDMNLGDKLKKLW